MKPKSKTTKQEDPKPSIQIQGNTFIGVKWDKDSVEVVRIVAEGLLTNAVALKKLSELFHSQNIQIEPMISLGNELPK